jgi:regulator of sigma E protease
MNFLSYVVPFLLVFTMVVFVHELGHYWIARKNGVKIEIFSIGFGPEILGFTDRHQTRWRISAIPLGGYVRMYGDADASSTTAQKTTSVIDEDSMRQHSLHHKSPWQKAAVAVAGPLSNIIFSFIALFLVYSFKGLPTIPASVSFVQPNSLADHVGLLPGDKFIRFNQQPIETFSDLLKKIQENIGKDVDIVVERHKENIKLHASFYTINKTNGKREIIKKLGIVPGTPTFEKIGVFESVKESLQSTWSVSIGLLQALPGLFKDKESRQQLGGIMTMGEQAAQSYQAGFWNLLTFMALLSINLGIINLLPIPMLDGGQIVISVVEGVRGKELSERFKEITLYFGIAIVASLMLLGMWNDIKRFIIDRFFQ